MTQEEVRDIIERTMAVPDYSFLVPFRKGQTWLEYFKTLINIIQPLDGTIAQVIQAVQNYQESEFFRKYVSFIMELKETTVDERIEFSEELSQKAEDNAGNVLAGLVDRLDNINKSKVLACLSKAKMHKFICIEDFFRLASVLERIPYVDLKMLPNYQEPFYDEDGDTELLYSTGVLRPVKFSEDGDLFILSPLGINLLKWGFLVEVNAKKVKGATTGLSWTEIEDESDV